MTPRSAVAAVLLVAMAGSWWWVLSGPAFRPATATAPAGSVRSAPPPEAPSVELGRLERSVPAVHGVRRNPFGTTTDISATPAGGGAARETATPGAPSADVVSPTVSLIGVSARTTPAGVERVAVFAGERGVLHARVGDVVAGVYRVERIAEGDVTLVRLPDERPVTLRLR